MQHHMSHEEDATLLWHCDFMQTTRRPFLYHHSKHHPKRIKVEHDARIVLIEWFRFRFNVMFWQKRVPQGGGGCSAPEDPLFHSVRPVVHPLVMFGCTANAGWILGKSWG